MNIAHLVASILISASFSNWSTAHTVESREIKTTMDPDTAKWKASFREFVKAISENNQEKLKSFIDFPIKNTGNEIWYLAESRLTTKIDPHKMVPFTESDFDRYHNSIFAIDFKQTLQSLDVDDLFLLGYASSPELEIVQGSKSKLTATYDQAKQKLELRLYTETGDQHISRSVIFYEFGILEGREIKFREVLVSR